MADPKAKPSQKKLKSNSDLKASNSNVVQQAKLMDSAGTAWHAVKYGNLELITKLFPSQCNVYNKGPVGENVFHIAMLLNTPSTLAIAKYLVKLYGSTLVNTPYQERKSEDDEPGQYEGETALHIAIVNRDFDMVKFLIQNGADVRARAYGAFFQEGSVVYYGEFPLSFAACTGQKDIVSYLKRHGAHVNTDRDTSGNTALHMCVYHEQADMYDHLVEFCGAMEHVRNNRGQTPLLLAASLGKVEMFQHIYNKRRKVAWAYGPVTSYSLSLHEIDTVQNTRSFVPSALELIVRKAHMDILNDPLIKTLLDTKWTRFAMVGFLIQASLYTVFLMSQTFLIWLHCDPDKWNTYSREALEVVCIIFAGTFVLLEVADVHFWTLGVYNRRRVMKSNSKHRAPMYPIPGDVHEGPTKTKSGFLSRMIKGAIAEGTEHDPAPIPQHYVLPLGAWQPQPSPPQQLLLPQGSVDAFPPTSGAFGAAAPAAGQPPKYRPSASGRRGGSSWDDLQVVQPTREQTTPASTGAAQLPPGSLWGEEEEDLEDLVARGGRAGQAGPGPSGAPAEGSGGVPLGEGVEGVHTGSVTVVSDAMPATFRPPMGAYPSSHQLSMGSKSRHQLFDPDNDPVDIVSVGLTSIDGGSMFGAHVHAPPMPSFMAPPQPTTSMLSGGPRGTTETVVGSGPSNTGASEAAAGQGGSLLGISLPPMQQGPSRLGGASAGGVPAGGAGSEDPSNNPRREGSAEIAGDKAEIKNRLRGGGGGDMPKSLKRVDSNRNRQGQRGDEAADTDEDDRQPLHVGGFMGNVRTILHATHGYYVRQAQDPITLVMYTHLLLTFVHFITWASSYGGVDGSGPVHEGTKQFDDIIISLAGLTGWGALVYFARGIQAMGQLHVMLERCLIEVLKFAALYFLANIGFTLAFYAVLNGTTYVTNPDQEQGVPALPQSAEANPFSNIGFGMIQVLRFFYGEASYTAYSHTDYQAKEAFATIYFVLYVFVVLLLMGNLLIAMIVHTYNAAHGQCEKVWRHRWASYVLRVERRMPLDWQQKYRLGEPSYDPQLQARVYNHVFEVVDDHNEEGSKGVGGLSEAQSKALEEILARLKKKGKKGM